MARTGEEVSAYVDSNGLGYSCQYGISSADFEDKELARLWDVAGEALVTLNDYLEEHYAE